MTSLNEYWLQKAKPPANFVTTVAEMAVRRTMRPFRSASNYVLAVRLPDAQDLRIYETAARGLLDPLSGNGRLWKLRCTCHQRGRHQGTGLGPGASVR